MHLLRAAGEVSGHSLGKQAYVVSVVKDVLNLKVCCVFIVEDGCMKVV